MRIFSRQLICHLLLIYIFSLLSYCSVQVTSQSDNKGDENVTSTEEPATNKPSTSDSNESSTPSPVKDQPERNTSISERSGNQSTNKISDCQSGLSMIDQFIKRYDIWFQTQDLNTSLLPSLDEFESMISVLSSVEEMNCVTKLSAQDKAIYNSHKDLITNGYHYLSSIIALYGASKDYDEYIILIEELEKLLDIYMDKSYQATDGKALLVHWQEKSNIVQDISNSYIDLTDRIIYIRQMVDFSHSELQLVPENWPTYKETLDYQSSFEQTLTNEENYILDMECILLLSYIEINEWFLHQSAVYDRSITCLFEQFMISLFPIYEQSENCKRIVGEKDKAALTQLKNSITNAYFTECK